MPEKEMNARPQKRWIKVKCAIGIFCIGGTLYNLIEILWRGYTHWTMFLVGGICFQLIGKIHTSFKKMHIFGRCVLCSLVVTLVEFISGCLFNLKLKMNVWDYSKMAFNIKGQVCLLYTVFWGILGLVALPVYNFCYKKLEKGLKWPRKKRFIQK